MVGFLLWTENFYLSPLWVHMKLSRNNLEKNACTVCPASPGGKIFANLQCNITARMWTLMQSQDVGDFPGSVHSFVCAHHQLFIRGSLHY